MRWRNRLKKIALNRFQENKNTKEVLDRIITEYQMKSNNSKFINKFKDFLRDIVLTACEADYLISIENMPIAM